MRRADDTHAVIQKDESRAILQKDEPHTVMQIDDFHAVMPTDDPHAKMLHEVQRIDSIATILGESCKEFAKTLVDISENLKRLIWSQYIYRQGENDQATMPVQDKETRKGLVPEKKNVCSLTSVNKSKKRIQILNPVQTDATNNFSSALKNKMRSVECTLLSQNDPLDQRMPLIIVCQSSSRLKPDVDLALETVKWTLAYVVIILHNGAESNLPAIPTAKKLQSYSNVTFVDMGFSYHGDILNCHQNKEAEVQLHSYITEFYKHVK